MQDFEALSSFKGIVDFTRTIFRTPLPLSSVVKMQNLERFAHQNVDMFREQVKLETYDNSLYLLIKHYYFCIKFIDSVFNKNVLKHG
jgi:hypothetical protein